MMTDYLGGYTAEWEVWLVDPETWDDAGVVEGVRSVSVDRGCPDGAPLLESGSMAIDSDGSRVEGRWCRISMKAEQGGTDRTAMATLLFERASSRVEKGTAEVTCDGHSVLKPAADRRMPYGAYAPEGCDGAAYAAGMLAECTPAPVRVEGSFTLVDDVVFDIGCTYLEAVWKVLLAAGWCIQIDGRGEITVRAKPTEPALELSSQTAALLLPGVDDDFSLADVPNTYYAIDDSRSAVAVNDDPSSPVSTVSRGRSVDVVDTSPVLVDGESIEMYAARKLAEASVVTRTLTYEREFWPDVVPYSLVRASLSEHGVEGDLRVSEQSLECGRGVKVTESAQMEVYA